MDDKKTQKKTKNKETNGIRFKQLKITKALSIDIKLNSNTRNQMNPFKKAKFTLVIKFDTMRTCTETPKL